MIVRYQTVGDFAGWDGARGFLQSIIEANGCRNILEVGSGANPTLSADYVHANSLNYVTSDSIEGELEKAPPAFRRMVLDLSEKIAPSLRESFDCVFARMVGEHIRDGALYHTNIFEALRPGGLAVHCMSCLGCLPFLANRILPDGASARMLQSFNPRNEVQHGKFKAYYSWASGPSRNMVNRFRSIGFEIVEYIGVFGHPYYARRLPLLHHLEVMKSNLLVRHPIPQLCSYATVILRKPKEVNEGKLQSQTESVAGYAHVPVLAEHDR
jgi:hypothetical protein